MVDIIIKGIIIGLLISVPVGPIGMLCIQRTLSRGRISGIVTGIGATTSDLLYTIVTLFFLSFVIDFIEIHRLLIQLLGSLLLVGFGIFTYRSYPRAYNTNEEGSRRNLLGDFFTSLGLTFSNPLILFILIALFAQFNFITNESTPFVAATGIISILLGATLWWTTLTFAVSRFSRKISTGGLKIINKITGIIIVIIGVVGVVSSLL